MAGVFPEPAEAVRLAVGPESITWRRAGDARTMFGAGAALMLQVAHPTVAAGVREHSDFKSDPWGRLWRTLDYVHMLVYGEPDAAVNTGQAMRAMHQRIRGVAPDGRHYHALEPEAYAWVHATLAATIGLLPQTARDRLGLDWTKAMDAELKVIGRLSRSTTPALPRSLKIVGPSYLRWRGEEIARGPFGHAA